MAAIELKLTEQIEFIDTHVAPGKENAEYASRVNPLRKIPALETDDGSIIVDSSVICEYLDYVAGNHRLFPAQEARRWQVQTAHSVANGILDAAVLLRYETFLRPESYRWDLWINEQWEKISNGLAWFESRSYPTLDTPATIDHIALACVLGYLDFRFQDYPWREQCNHLAASIQA